MDDGGIELFIDCCEIGEPWKRLCAEVKREEQQHKEEESQNISKTSKKGEAMESNSAGIFSKIAQVGVEVLSSIV